MANVCRIEVLVLLISVVWSRGTTTFSFQGVTVLTLVLVGLGVEYSSLASVHQMIYTPIPGYPCVRLLDKDRQIGCGARAKSMGGELQIIDSTASLTEYIENPQRAVILLFPELFTRNNLDQLAEKKEVQAIFVVEGSTQIGSPFSPEDTIPNREFGITTQFEWNPEGNDLSFQDYHFPIWTLSQNVSEQLLELGRYNRDDAGYPRWAARVGSFMQGGHNSETCLRRELCLPLGGKSVWSSFGFLNTSKPIIIASAAADSSAFFHDLAHGASAEASSTIVLLAAAQALSTVDMSGFDRQLVLFFFTGESWGYLGSRKFVDDIQHFQCREVDEVNPDECDDPFALSMEFLRMKLDNISAMVHISQLGQADELWLHSTNNGIESEQLATTFLDTSQRSLLNTTFELVSGNPERGIPPSSLMSFLRERPDLPGVVISDHSASYLNRYYHSRLDSDVRSTAHLCETATLVARSLLDLASGGSLESDVRADCELVEELSLCLTNNLACTLVESYLGEFSKETYVPTHYVGVFGWSESYYFTSLPMRFIHEFMFDQTALARGGNCSTNDDCLSDAEEGNWHCLGANGTCASSSTYYHDARSPGIVWESNKWKIVDSTQPTWTESNWGSLWAELYYRTDPLVEGMFFFAGIVELGLCFVAIFYLKKYLSHHYKLA